MKKDLSHISISSNDTNDVYDNGKRFHLVIKTETEELRKLEMNNRRYY